jgi:ADP-ribose pyrophosphatase
MHEKTLTSKFLYRGRLLGLEIQDVELANGKKAFREIVRHGGAVAVLARVPDGRFVFVRQFRKPVEQDMIEVVAGNRGKDEDPEACAVRELREETGFDARRIRRLGFIHPSPGYVDERIDLYFADVDVRPGPTNPDEDEHVEVLLMSRDEFLGQVRAGEIHDSKTLATWLLYEKVEAGGDA